MPGARLVEMPTWECLQLLRERTIGRLAVREGEYPVALPISYKVADRQGAPLPLVLVRTRPGGVFERGLGPASLELDDIDVPAGHTWSVVVRGSLEPVGDRGDLPAPQPWLSDDRHLWLALKPHVITGRRFVAVADQTFSVEWEHVP